VPNLFHISEDPNITHFEPRVANEGSGHKREPLVWAIEDRLLHNYLLPRNCPRVTFYATDSSKPEDVEQFLGQTSATFVVALESAWFENAMTTVLYKYAFFPPDTFELSDEGAGYYVSPTAVEPSSVVKIEHPLDEMLKRKVELRITPSLRKLQEAVVGSSLQFSCIRMRNAGP
jgi:hypothetical protein